MFKLFKTIRSPFHKTNENIVNQIWSQNQNSRDKWIIDILTNIPAGNRILDAGAGEMPYKKYCSHLNYLSQDFSKYNGSGNLEGLQTIKWDIANIDIISDIISIPENNESFDVILCSEVLEHLPEPLEAIKEFSRLLKENGKLILTAPFCSLTHFAPFHYYSGFNKYFYYENLKKYNLQIDLIINNGNYFDYISQELLRTKQFSQPYLKFNKNKFNNHIDTIVKTIYKISKKDNTTSNILCFGYQIVAHKIN